MSKQMPPDGLELVQYWREQATALRAAHEALLRRTQSLETALDQERARLAWAADNTGRDVWLDQFDRRFSKGEGADGADDLRAAIDALLSGQKESPH